MIAALALWTGSAAAQPANLAQSGLISTLEAPIIVAN
jgi:hypothetical protein